MHGPIQFEPHVQDLELTTDRQLEITLGITPIAEAIMVPAAPPQSEPSQPGKPRTRVRVGGNVQKARLVQFASPIYPADAQREGLEGTVLMEAVIRTEGRLVGLSRLNSMVDERLAAATSEAVLRWKYQPTLLNGRPVEVAVTVTVAFELP
ncbi:MAG: energy transducer TonB [Bryobacterales bacterium]|nr:energy transducer TonB [Bryobacterales bacterium]